VICPGIFAPTLRAFLPDPSEFQDMEKAAEAESPTSRAVKPLPYTAIMTLTRSNQRGLDDPPDPYAEP
jgi:hypothetical protein